MQGEIHKTKRPGRSKVKPVVDRSFRIHCTEAVRKDGAALTPVTSAKDQEDWLYPDPVFAGPLIPGYLRSRELVEHRWEQLQKSMDRILSCPVYGPGLVKVLDDTLFMTEQMSLTFRQEIDDLNILFRDEEPVSDTGEGFITDPPVSIQLDDGVLHIFSPITLLRTPAHSWYLAKMAGYVLQRYEAKHGMIKDHIRKPVYVIVKRKDTFCKRGYRDNENLETSKMINMIFRFLRFTDCAVNAGYVSLFEQVENVEDCGTEIIIFSKYRLADCYNLFSF